MSQRFVRDASFRAFSRPCCAVTLPGTTVSARTSSSGEFSASRMASASSVPGSVSIITFLGVAGGLAPTGEAAFVPACVAGAPQKITTANASARNAANGRSNASREVSRTPQDRSGYFALLQDANCGVIFGITSGQGPPSPQNGSRLSSGSRRVNTKLTVSKSFPQTANEFYKRTLTSMQIRNNYYKSVNELCRCCYPLSQLKRQTLAGCAKLARRGMGIGVLLESVPQ